MRHGEKWIPECGNAPPVSRNANPQITCPTLTNNGNNTQTAIFSIGVTEGYVPSSSWNKWHLHCCSCTFSRTQMHGTHVKHYFGSTLQGAFLIITRIRQWHLTFGGMGGGGLMSMAQTILQSVLLQSTHVTPVTLVSQFWPSESLQSCLFFSRRVTISVSTKTTRAAATTIPTTLTSLFPFPIKWLTQVETIGTLLRQWQFESCELNGDLSYARSGRSTS